MPGLGGISPDNPYIQKMIREGRIVDQKARCGSTAPVPSLAPVVSSEEEFQQALFDFAKPLCWKCYHTRDSRRSQPGFPDVVLVRERIIWAELKVGNNATTEAQDDWLAALRAAGQEVYVWWPESWPEVVAVLSLQGGPPRPPSPSGPEVR